MSLIHLTRILQSNPDVVESLTTQQLLDFIGILRHLREKLSWSQGSSADGPPIALLANVQEFITIALGIGIAKSSKFTIFRAWDALRELIWSLPVITDPLQDARLADLFVLHGMTSKVGMLLSRSVRAKFADQM